MATQANTTEKMCGECWLKHGDPWNCKCEKNGESDDKRQSKSREDKAKRTNCG